MCIRDRPWSCYYPFSLPSTHKAVGPLKGLLNRFLTPHQKKSRIQTLKEENKPYVTVEELRVAGIIEWIHCSTLQRRAHAPLCVNIKPPWPARQYQAPKPRTVIQPTQHYRDWFRAWNHSPNMYWYNSHSTAPCYNGRTWNGKKKRMQWTWTWPY